MEYITLNNGIQMPQVGLGTFLIPRENVIDTIGMAYELGYRSFDTAWRYHNEDLIAKALKIHHIPREEVFITTKVSEDSLWMWEYYSSGWKRKLNFRTRTVSGGIEDSFRNLKTDYIDLFLLHSAWPHFWDMWRILTDLYHKGRIRAIGVSNCLPIHIDSLKEVSDVLPAINQFEISPLNTQKKLISWCQKQNITCEAMSTFSHRRSSEPRMEIIDNPIIHQIAEKHGKSTVQVVLRWLIQQGIVVIPKTWNPAYLEQNIDVFDFVLLKEEMAAIDALDQGKFLNYSPYPSIKNIPGSYPRWQDWFNL